MKLKIVVVDLELTKRQKRILAAALGGCMLGAAAIAYAGVPNSFNTGQQLTAKALNDNFAYLDDAGAALAATVANVASSTPKVTEWQTYTPEVDDTQNGTPEGSPPRAFGGAWATPWRSACASRTPTVR